jgi:hypothetical protein
LRFIAILLVRFQCLDEFHHRADLVADVHDSLRCDVIAERLERASRQFLHRVDEEGQVGFSESREQDAGGAVLFHEAGES